MNKHVEGLPGENLQELIVAIIVGQGELRTWCTRLRESHPCTRQRCPPEDDISSDIWDRVPGTLADNTRDFHRVGNGAVIPGYLEERHEHAVLSRREAELDGDYTGTYDGALLASHVSAVLEIHIHTQVGLGAA